MPNPIRLDFAIDDVALPAIVGEEVDARLHQIASILEFLDWYVAIAASVCADLTAQTRLTLATFFGTEHANLLALDDTSRQRVPRFMPRATENAENSGWYLETNAGLPAVQDRVRRVQLRRIESFLLWYSALSQNVLADVGRDCRDMLVRIFEQEFNRIRASRVPLKMSPLKESEAAQATSTRTVKVYSRRTLRWLTRNLYFTEKSVGRRGQTRSGRYACAAYFEEFGARVDWAKDLVRKHAGIVVTPECLVHRGYAEIELCLANPILEELVDLLLEWDEVDAILWDDPLDRDDLSEWLRYPLYEPLAWLKVAGGRDSDAASDYPILRPSRHITQSAEPRRSQDKIIAALDARRVRMMGSPSVTADVNPKIAILEGQTQV
ncbi:hypothetical protein [Burkholderia sp. Ac-20365]|uniref:hypothetical protein n=1 Tax=Burkholderia sp. Ac-20365 TaxID=2703897 RepID=UPI00197C29EF|nr:hypothetical protein [Burkholderia sp. Ac-20365]MBN3761308.1 hypothetical protein [Burkholderia sp. Ac-20365]